MERKLLCLVDYKNRFGYKGNANPYSSGMEKNKLENYFNELGFKIEFCPFSEVNFKQDWGGVDVIYTSSQDINLFYKNYIEDIVYGLELAGAKVIPSYKLLKAHHNKVFMEIIRDLSDCPEIKGITSKYYGCLEEIIQQKESIEYPIVIKPAAGAVSSGVSSAKNYKELCKNVRNISRYRNFRYELKEIIRSYLHKGYEKESKHRKKFVIQNFIPNLKNDWKVYVFGNKLFVTYRPITKKNDFRASGSDYENYYYGKNARVPDGLLDFALKVYKLFPVPNISIDICFDGKKFYLIEFQFIYFGTGAILTKNSKEYFEYDGSSWIAKENNYNVEKIYTESIVNFLNSNEIDKK